MTDQPGNLDGNDLLAWYRTRYGEEVWRTGVAEVTVATLRAALNESRTAEPAMPPIPAGHPNHPDYVGPPATPEG